MLSGLWKYIVGILAAIAGLLGAALLYTGKQKERAQEAARVAKANAKGIEKAREVEHSIDKAKAKARETAAEVEREQNEHKAAGTRPRTFGDLRMHDGSSGPDQP